MTEDRKATALWTIYSLLSYNYGTTVKKKIPHSDLNIPATADPCAALTIY